MNRPVLTRPTDYLLVDISNSYAKFAFASTKRISTPVRIATNKLSGSVFSRFLGQRRVRKIVVSSVVPKKNRTISKAAGKTGVLWLNSTVKLGVGIDYPDPETIGADRLANAAAVTALYGCPAIVVDFGTAVTFDIVSARRNYIGGVIAPGLEAITNFLSCADPGGAVSERKASRGGHRRLRATHRSAVAGDHGSPCAPHSGGATDYGQSQFVIVR